MYTKVNFSNSGCLFKRHTLLFCLCYYFVILFFFCGSLLFGGGDVVVCDNLIGLNNMVVKKSHFLPFFLVLNSLIEKMDQDIDLRQQHAIINSSNDAKVDNRVTKWFRSNNLTNFGIVSVNDSSSLEKHRFQKHDNR